MKQWRLIHYILSFLITFSAEAHTITGKVIHISDGDTLKILTASNQQVKIRLAGIDTPEKSQPFGNKAKQALAALTFQKQATVDVETIDRYGRTVGRVYVEGTDVNAELIRQGMAWVYRKYTTEKLLYDLESKAIEARRGLWADDEPIEPWLWRKGTRTAKSNTSPIKGMIVGNKRSKVYHLNNCPSYSAVSETNRVLLVSEELAIQRGYRKAGNCP